MMNEFKFTKVVQNFADNDIFLNSDSAKFNQTYMLYSERISISVYELNKNKFLDTIELENFYHFDFHSNKENIFFVCTTEDVIIYKIDNSKIVKIDEMSDESKIYLDDFSEEKTMYASVMNPRPLIYFLFSVFR